MAGRHLSVERYPHASRHLAQRSEAGHAAPTRHDRSSLSHSPVNNLRFGGRGNAPVQVAFMQQMKQTHGNRALQRYMRRSSSGQEKTPVQRCGGQVHAGCSACGGDKLEEPMPAAQRSHGSRVALQRLTAEEKQQNLASPKYAGNERLEKAYDNSPIMGIGESGKPVRLVQEGLVADGFAMPKSTKEDGTMDGVYGGETHSVIQQFQAKHKLQYKDGAVGHETMGKLDELALGSAPDNKPPTGFEIEGKPQTDDPRKIFFLRGSAEIPDTTERVKLLLKANPPDRRLRLMGMVSEDEDPKLAAQRIKTVKEALINDGHDPRAIQEDPQPSVGQGRPDYRKLRAVEVIPEGDAAKEPNCEVTPSFQPCDPKMEGALAEGRGRADELLAGAIGALDSPGPNTKQLLDEFFKDSSDTTAANVKTNLSNMVKELDHLSKPQNHSCGTKCASLCRTARAMLEGDPASGTSMILCPGLAEDKTDERARVLIHETSHGTDVIGGKPMHGTEDVATGHWRKFEFLTKDEAIKNADTYALFVMAANDARLPTAKPPKDTMSATNPLSAKEEKTAKQTFALVQERMRWVHVDLNFLHGEIHKSKPPAKGWSDTEAEKTMGLVAPRFGLTMPPALPTMKDQVSVAGILDRYFTFVMKPMYFSINLKKTDTGKSKWSPGPGAEAELGSDLFDLGETPTDDHINLIVAKLVEATAEIPEAHRTSYVTLAQAISDTQ